MTTIQINGVTTEVPAGAIAFKYADPTEGARWVYDESDLADIRSEDPGLLVIARVRISDGTETVRASSIEEYAASYGFNESGEVNCRVVDEEGEILRTFTIRSDDGRRGYLVGITEVTAQDES